VTKTRPVFKPAVDPEFPWRLTLRNFTWQAYPYRTSIAGWNALLSRARAGDPEAEWSVAAYYEDGCKDRKGKILVRRSVRKSIAWLRRAAKHGSVSAQNNLGVALGSGTLTAKDIPAAVAWLRSASDGGDAAAALNLAITYRENKNLKMAVKWFRRAADSGDDEALIQLGIHYYWGKGVRKDAAAAVRFFRKATKGKNLSGCGRDDAFFCLGLAYFEGKGVKQSIRTAAKLLRRANVDDDNPAASKLLSQLGN